MQIKIIGDNLEITSRIRKLIDSKINQGLEKYLAGLSQEIKIANMNLKRHSRWGYKINFNLWLPEKYQIYAESRGERLLSTLVDLREQLKRQIKRYKAKVKKIKSKDSAKNKS